MMKPRNDVHHPKPRQEKPYHGIASTHRGAGPVAAGRTAYREDYQRDHGPDLDEPLDGTESEREF